MHMELRTPGLLTRPRHLKTAAALLLAAGLLLGGCGSPASVQPTAAPTSAPAPESPSPEPSPSAPAEQAGPAAPLTGLPLADGAALTARPYTVMVNNFSAARPQSGLTHADMLWEVLAEGGITRLIAVFQSDTVYKGAIGPVRSIRPYLIEIGESFHGVLTHAGASTDAYDILQHQGKPYLDEISNAGGYYWRDKTRKAPHNLYTDLEKITKIADRKGYLKSAGGPSYTFSPNASVDAASPAATHVELRFQLQNYKVSYEYDSGSDVYKRFIDGKPHEDRESKEQLAAGNLVVIGANHRAYDDYGRLEVGLKDGGPALLIQRGQVMEAQWKRGADGSFRLEKDGRELSFVPGKTFWHVMPLDPSLEGHVTYS
ncbi:DUF3048 domain-containing protein [Paenibacillus sp. D51F]